MPLLKNILPALADNCDLKQCEAFKFRDCEVKAIKLTTGSPCSTHADLFDQWPGPEKNIVEWYVLDSGHVVGKGTDGSGKEFYPVMRLDSN